LLLHLLRARGADVVLQTRNGRGRGSEAPQDGGDAVRIRELMLVDGLVSFLREPSHELAPSRCKSLTIAPALRAWTK
jgi:hypothetical protein